MIEIISNWIFIWFILFILRIIQFNPLLIIIITFIITNIYAFYFFSKYKPNYYNLTKFIIINTIIKIIPIIIILIYYPKYTIYDFYFSIFFFISYLFTMFILDIDIYISYQKIYLSYTNDNIYNNDRSTISKLYDFYFIRYSRSTSIQ
jgi:hypothetical protein